MEDIRRMEEETRKELDEVRQKTAQLLMYLLLGAKSSVNMYFYNNNLQCESLISFLSCLFSDESEGPGKRDGGSRRLRSCWT